MDGIYLIWNLLVTVSMAVLVINAVIYLANKRLAEQEQRHGKETQNHFGNPAEPTVGGSGDRPEQADES